MNFNRELFAKCIRIKLKNEGISHPEAAKQIGISKCSVYLMTKEETTCLPGLYIFYSTCAWLGCTPNDFFLPENTNHTEKKTNE